MILFGNKFSKSTKLSQQQLVRPPLHFFFFSPNKGVDGGSMYASQKVAPKDLRIPEESQTTLDSYICSGQENNFTNQETKKSQNSAKQQISIDSFLAKKSSVNLVDLERAEKESLETSSAASHSNPPAGQTPKLPNPYVTYSARSAPVTNSDPVSTQDHIESTMRVESKSSPLPLRLNMSAPSPASFPTKTGEISPRTIAKIEGNRLKALARRNQILGRQDSHPALLPPSLPSSIQQCKYIQPPPMKMNTNPSLNPHPQPIGVSQRPVHSIHPPSFPVPIVTEFPNFSSDPSSRPPQSPSGHVFSTGTGNSLRISQDAIEKANSLISNPANPNPTKKATRSVD
jgi:hypothetical protein